MNETLNIFFLCLSYNFNISYFELELNLDSTDLNIICFPEKWLPLFVNTDLLDTLFKMCLKFYLED